MQTIENILLTLAVIFVIQVITSLRYETGQWPKWLLRSARVVAIVEIVCFVVYLMTLIWSN